MSLVEIAKSIYETALLIEQQAQDDGVAKPLQQTHLLHYMTQGPLSALRTLGWTHLDTIGLELIIRHKIQHKVPSEGSITYQSLAEQCSVPLPLLKRVLRQTMTNFIFAEDSSGNVTHSVFSRFMRDNAYIQCQFQANMDESWRASTRVVDAISDPVTVEETIKSAWGLENNATMPLFQELEANHPERAEKFAHLMTFYAGMAKAEPTVKNYDWKSLPDGAKIVDVGGGKGSLSISLAEEFSKHNFVVQDLPETVAEGEKAVLPESVKGRVTFQAHNFFEPQPQRDADVYFFRAVFHNWTDKDCVRILLGLVPALRKGAKILIQDPYLPEPGTVGAWKNRDLLAASLRMMIFFNSYDRNEDEWKALLKRADTRFRLSLFKRPDEQPVASNMCFVEITWDG
ncbi:Grayanic acid biosynthesis cluster O-methyltransferase [Pseudocercospora fuligena]|uniref:Grayanic acid biosynthesis cluster O-methyltransferase n=1 Tax=Pseudocercospora fuligena TaxID=685502 RepID=A0A8H6RKE7_9PEZI|nr:Grayanic acid biosynthesis cluster O-methyltransferase [Pseudocercospora fuligena]